MRNIRLTQWTFFMVICFVLLSFIAEARNNRSIISDENTIVTTTNGKVQGYLEGDVYTFKGVPYAVSERFMPPSNPPYSDDVVKCRVYGPKAPQNQNLKFRGNPQSDNDFGFQFNLEPMDEKNCLVLNVWTKGINDGKKRPVFVWFHGGGYATGSGHDLPCYEGRSLAEKGDIVVVTVNHRLNALGYFDMSGLGGRYKNSVNLGMQDLVKSLEWVHENIAGFGGDPNCVTIGGQSGGGGKVSTVMMMPAAKDLFHRAIVQSGSFTRHATNTYAELYGQALLNELGLKIEDVEELANVPYEKLVDAINKSVRTVNMTLSSQGQSVNGGMMGPVIDGKHVVAPGFESSAPEVSRNVPMMIGWNFNEFDFSGGKEDTMFRDAAISQARNKTNQGDADVYLYMFNWKPSGNVLGACHGMELPFMFNNIDLQPEMTGATDDAYELADKMSSAWIEFIKTGHPGAKGLPKWEPYNDIDQPTMVFDRNSYLKKRSGKEHNDIK